MAGDDRLMFVRCASCGMVLPHHKSMAYVIEVPKEGLKPYYFCSKEHMLKHAESLSLSLDEEDKD